MKVIPITSTTVRFTLTAVVLAALAHGPPVWAQQELPPLVVHAENQKAKFAGIIVQRSGDTLRVREGDVATHTIVIDDHTRIQTPNGLFKMQRKRRDQTALVPGLLMQVDGHGAADGTLIADELTFSTRSLNTAKQIEVGGEVTRSQVSANSDSIDIVKRRLQDSITHANARINNLDNYVEKISTTVNFHTNESELGKGARGVLDDLANRISDWKGYLIEVHGYADTTGTDPHNLELSERRAESVVRYLVDDKGIPVRRVLNPTGFGSASSIATNATADGRAMNRRVTVRVLLNKGNGSDSR